MVQIYYITVCEAALLYITQIILCSCYMWLTCHCKLKKQQTDPKSDFI